MEEQPILSSVQTKLDLLFDGVRYTPALAEAGTHSFPNFYPYRLGAHEGDPGGSEAVTIPYLLYLSDETVVRLRGNSHSPWRVEGNRADGYRLCRDGDAGTGQDVTFATLPNWMRASTSDGYPMAQAGVGLHGDMAVVNVAPACEYFPAGRAHGESLRCAFCSYGAPDGRSEGLGQVMGRPELPPLTLRRMQETLEAAVEEGTVRHVYLVGGCMADWSAEGVRYVRVAEAVREALGRKVPVTCGSGALPRDALQRLCREGLADAVCFNLEIYSEALFARVCPGKQRFVGYDRWLRSLDEAVDLWGGGRVYTAMVAGIELLPEYEMTPAEALSLALAGVDDLCGRGVLPVYSLYLPPGGRPHADEHAQLRSYFEQLGQGYKAARTRTGLDFWDGFWCHRCAYMQIEPDLDRAGSDGRS